MRNEYLGMVGKGVEAVTSQWQVACDRVNASAVADLYAADAFILTRQAQWHADERRFEACSRGRSPECKASR